eukprot:TRINITY_DN4380_c4_g1_i1.p1 TRINITY_DN4380_c4_g1~~TRINITY_DN4380_c4_g1_i1.p1  ORF type:complete len:1417 (-),score=353.21 TRINITY_DN4380_c4_g1_i1:213-4394(-)
MPRKVVLDVDGSCGSMIALEYALRSPDVDVSAVCTVGGVVDAEQAAINVLRIMALVGVTSTIPILIGSNETLSDSQVANSLQICHQNVCGTDGLGDLGDEAYPALNHSHIIGSEHRIEAFYGDLLLNHGDTSLIVLGPATNLALALLDNPLAAAGPAEIILVSGTTTTAQSVHYSNVIGADGFLAGSEFNSYYDPEALRIVLESGATCIIVPLETAPAAAIPRSRMAMFSSHYDRCARWIFAATEKQLNHAERTGKGKIFTGLMVHTVLAVMTVAFQDAALRPVSAEVIANGGQRSVRLYPMDEQRPANAAAAFTLNYVVFMKRYLGHFATAPVSKRLEAKPTTPTAAVSASSVISPVSAAKMRISPAQMAKEKRARELLEEQQQTNGRTLSPNKQQSPTEASPAGSTSATTFSVAVTTPMTAPRPAVPLLSLSKLSQPLTYSPLSPPAQPPLPPTTFPSSAELALTPQPLSVKKLSSYPPRPVVDGQSAVLSDTVSPSNSDLSLRSWRSPQSPQSPQSQTVSELYGDEALLQQQQQQQQQPSYHQETTSWRQHQSADRASLVSDNTVAVVAFGSTIRVPSPRTRAAVAQSTTTPRLASPRKPISPRKDTTQGQTPRQTPRQVSPRGTGKITPRAAKGGAHNKSSTRQDVAAAAVEKRGAALSSLEHDSPFSLLSITRALAAGVTPPLASRSVPASEQQYLASQTPPARPHAWALSEPRKSVADVPAVIPRTSMDEVVPSPRRISDVVEGRRASQSPVLDALRDSPRFSPLIRKRSQTFTPSPARVRPGSGSPKLAATAAAAVANTSSTSQRSVSTSPLTIDPVLVSPTSAHSAGSGLVAGSARSASGSPWTRRSMSPLSAEDLQAREKRRMERYVTDMCKRSVQLTKLNFRNHKWSQRRFRLSADRKALQWGSLYTSSLPLDNVLFVVIGPRTKNFRAAMQVAPILCQWRCFSLVCADRTVDLMAPDDLSAQCWALGLSHLTAASAKARGRQVLSNKDYVLRRLRMRLEQSMAEVRLAWTHPLVTQLRRLAKVASPPKAVVLGRAATASIYSIDSAASPLVSHSLRPSAPEPAQTTPLIGTSAAHSPVLPAFAAVGSARGPAVMPKAVPADTSDNRPRSMSDGKQQRPILPPLDLTEAKRGAARAHSGEMSPVDAVKATAFQTLTEQRRSPSAATTAVAAVAISSVVPASTTAFVAAPSSGHADTLPDSASVNAAVDGVTETHQTVTPPSDTPSPPHFETAAFAQDNSAAGAAFKPKASSKLIKRGPTSPPPADYLRSMYSPMSDVSADTFFASPTLMSQQMSPQMSQQQVSPQMPSDRSSPVARPSVTSIPPFPAHLMVEKHRASSALDNVTVATTDLSLSPSSMNSSDGDVLETPRQMPANGAEGVEGTL